MIRMLIKNWWLLLLRGILAAVFAVFIFAFLPFVPAPLVQEFAFAGLVVIFALLAIVTGVLTIAAAVRGAGQGGWSWLLLADGIGVTAGGLVILISPALTLAHVIELIGLTALFVGTLEVAAGIHLRRNLADEWLLISGGVISVVFATCLFLTGGSIQTVLTWLSVYAAATGLSMAGLALRLRGLGKSIHALAEPRPVAKAAGQSSGA